MSNVGKPRVFVGGRNTAYVILLFWLTCGLSAQGQKAPSSKKFWDDTKEMFQNLEIVDLQEPPAQMSNEEIRLPAFGLHNKRHADLIPPVDISPGREGLPAPLGYPLWVFTRTDGKLVVTKAGSVIYAPKIEADGVLEVGGKTQTAMVIKELRLVPGVYKVTAEFRPYFLGRVGGPTGPLPVLSSAKSHKVTIREALASSAGGATPAREKKAAAASVSTKSGQSPREEMLRRNDIAKQGKSALMDAIVVDELQLGADVIKVGAPLAYSFTLNVRPSAAVPDEVAGKTMALMYSWQVRKAWEKGVPEYVRAMSNRMSKDVIKELRDKKTYTLSSLVPVETQAMGPGSYELEICVWEDGVAGMRGALHTKYYAFKVVK